MNFFLRRLGKKWLYNSKLRHKMLFTFLFLIILPLGAFQFFASHKISQLVINLVEFSARQGFEQTHSFLTYKLQHINNITDVIAFDPNVTKVLTKDASAYSINEQLQDYNAMKTFLKSLQDGIDVVHIRFYVPESTYYANEKENFFSLEDTYKTAWFQRLNESNTKLFWFPPSYLEEPTQQGDTYVSVARMLRNPDNYFNTIGLIRVDVEESIIRSILAKANTVKNSVTYLQNQEGLLVSASDNELAAKMRLIPTNTSPASLERDAAFTKNNENYYLSKQVAGSDWTMITVIPFDEILSQSTKLRNELILILIIIAALAYFIAYILAFSVTRRIAQLISKMKGVQHGNLDPISRTQGKDEMGELIETYNFMVAKIALMNQEQYDLGQAVKTSELKALQSQINPHFLYNTFDLISWMADRNMKVQIKQIIKALAKFYRLSLSNGKDIISLRDELQHVSFYVQIQNIRFENKITFEINVDEAILDYVIPKITLQPIVENAIIHGVYNRLSRAGTISIQGSKITDDLVITIRDDGVGMSPEQLASLGTEDFTSRITGSGYGIKNVTERLKLYFGENYGLSYKSEQTVGTTVEIRIPAKKEIN